MTPNSNTYKQFYNTTDSKLSGVYAEVRGKYARPPPLMQKSVQADILAPKDYVILSRPSTAGSLKPRSSRSQKPQAQNLNKPEESQGSPIKRRIFKYRTTSSNSKYEEDRKSVQGQQKPKEKVEIKEQEVKNTENDEVNNEEAEENLDQVEELKEKDEEKSVEGSQFSGITTSSQRRYILELESMLRMEKLKRIQIEETLKKAIENSD